MGQTGYLLVDETGELLATNAAADACLQSVDSENAIFENLFLESESLKMLLSGKVSDCLLYTSPSPRDQRGSRMPSSA